MKRATASVLTIAAVTALACKGSGEATLDLEVTASAGGRVDIVRTVDARTITDSVRVPYSHPFDAQQVVVRATARTGTAGCRITYGIKVLDEDSGRVASCSATRPGGAA